MTGRRCPAIPAEIATFIDDLRRVGVGVRTIHARVTERWPDAGVTRWGVESREKPPKPVKAKAVREKPQPTTCACGQPGLRHGHGWLKVCDECNTAHYGPTLTRGIPDLDKLLEFVDAAARVMPARAEAAFDIKTALRRLDLIERRALPRDSTGRSAIQ